MFDHPMCIIAGSAVAFVLLYAVELAARYGGDYLCWAAVIPYNWC